MLIRSLIKLSRNGSLVRTLNAPIKQNQQCHSALIYSHYLNFSTENQGIDSPTEPKKPRPKKPPVPKITLLSSEDDIMITTLEEAQKLSKRRDLKLVRIRDQDSKTQRPVYKLMNSAEYRAEDLKQRETQKQNKENASVKGSKILAISSNISEHDLEVKSNRVASWVSKRYEVNVSITNESNNKDKLVSSAIIVCS